jgi:acetyl-CoA C-acetyltransferase/acetyl-CoA acyltransferase
LRKPMKKLSKKIYVTAGYNTIFMGTGRPEFNPTKPMRSFEEYLKETAEGTCNQIKNPYLDEGVIANFMAGRFIKQGNLPGFLPFMVPSLQYKPCTRVEGACGSGGIAIATGIKSILAGCSNSVFVTGFEIQNIVKAVYGADYLAGAAYYNGMRKNGHAHFFPNIFSKRAGVYFEKYGAEKSRKALAQWFVNAIENARKSPKAQEYTNAANNLMELGLTAPNPNQFLEYLNYYDCSKISDGASSLILADDEGLLKLGVDKKDCVEIIGFAMAEGDITAEPKDPAIMDTTEFVAKSIFQNTGTSIKDIGLLELHDCFTISGLLALEAIGATAKGKGADFIIEGQTKSSGNLPVNLSGGLIGFGHPTGATGVRQMVDLLHQFTQKSANQIKPKKDLGMMISMGGNDKSLAAFIVKGF